MQENFKRIDYLDSARGIAALMVVVYHFIGWKWSDNLYYHLGSLVFNGSDAVSFFFVLSGFVLSFRYFQTNSEINYGRFIYTRALRIYPAFIFTVLLNFLYWNRDNLSLDLLKDALFYKQDLWRELLLVRKGHNYYVPGWSLGVEMSLSLLVPLLVAASRQSIKYVIWLMPVAVYMGSSYLYLFVFHFCLGMVLAYFYREIQAFNFREHRLYRYRYLLFLGVFLLFSIRHLERIFPFGETYRHYAGIYNFDFFHVTGFASFLFLAWIINNKKVQQALSVKPLLFLGRISYSVYLMHWLIVAVVMDKWDWLNGIFGSGKVTFGVMLPFTLIATLLAATVVYHLVEKQFIRLAKKPVSFRNKVMA